MEGAAHADLSRGASSRAIVAAIIGVGPGGHRVKSAIAGDGRQPRVELVLAEVAAIFGVRAVFGPSDFTGLDDFVPKRELASHSQRELAMADWITGAFGGDAQDPIAQDLGRRICEIRAVDAAAEG